MASNNPDSATDLSALVNARSVLQKFLTNDLPERTKLNVDSSSASASDARNILQEFFQDDLPADANAADVLAEIRRKLQDKLRSLTRELDDAQRRLEHADEMRKTRLVTEKLQEKNKVALEEQVLRLLKRLADCKCHLRPSAS